MRQNTAYVFWDGEKGAYLVRPSTLIVDRAIGSFQLVNHTGKDLLVTVGPELGPPFKDEKGIGPKVIPVHKDKTKDLKKVHKYQVQVFDGAQDPVAQGESAPHVIIDP